MRIYKGLKHPIILSNPVAAVGSFDGVHLGHQRILQYLCDFSRQVQGESVVITFDPHPQQVLYKDSDFFPINTPEANLRLIEAQGVDVVVVIPFTLQLSQLSYVEFMDRIIIGKIHVKTLVMGPDHAFGRNREGDTLAIETLCRTRGVQTAMVPELSVHESGVRSAKIRKLILDEKWMEVDDLLGYHYERIKK